MQAKTLEPVWNEKFRFIAAMSDPVTLEMYDRDFVNDEMMGQALMSACLSCWAVAEDPTELHCLIL